MCHFHAWEKSVRKKCINPIKPRPYSKRPIVCMQNIESCFLLIWIIMEKRKSQVLLHYSAKIFCAKDVLITIITMSRPSWTLLRSRRLSSSAVKEGNYICQAFPPSNLDYQFKDETTCQPKNPDYFIPIPYFTRSSKWWSWRRGGWGWVGVVKFPLFSVCLNVCVSKTRRLWRLPHHLLLLLHCICILIIMQQDLAHTHMSIEFGAEVRRTQRIFHG